MKVLVIDDSPLHQASALQTLKDHDLTIVGSYDEAFKLLEEPYETIEKETFVALERSGYKFPGENASEEECKDHLKELGRQKRTVRLPSPRFEVVLTDLLMPASEREMGDNGFKFVGQEMPVGFGLVLMAAQCGARFAAVFTDTSHHNHPASALLDPFESRCPHEYNPAGICPRFNINGTVVGFYGSPFCLVDGTTCSDCNGTGGKEVCYCVKHNADTAKMDCVDCNGTGCRCWKCRNTGKDWGKDWGKVLQHLLDS